MFYIDLVQKVKQENCGITSIGVSGPTFLNEKSNHFNGNMHDEGQKCMLSWFVRSTEP